MKLYEMLEMSGPMLKLLHANGIRMSDYAMLDVYKDYRELCARRYKKTYIIAVLSERYHICERKVYKIVSKMECDAKMVQCDSEK